jgi:hypothetical protein
VPEAARFGIKNFDYGRIRLYDGENLYLNVKNPDKFSGIVCVNSDGCPYAYYTRSNTLPKTLNDNTTLYVVYNDKRGESEKVVLQAVSDCRLTYRIKKQ